MKYLKTFESVNRKKILIIIDVQKSFKKHFTNKYINELKKYCNKFDKVIQIWDNHIDGKVNKNYLYDKDPDIPVHSDLYHFPNQTEIIEKRYNYNVKVDFYKDILDNEIYNKIKKLEKNNKLKKGDLFKTNKDTAIVYIGNNHKWFQIPKKLFKCLSNIKNEEVVITGGSGKECLEDVYISAKSLGIDIKKNDNYIYSGGKCPIE